MVSHVHVLSFNVTLMFGELLMAPLNRRRFVASSLAASLAVGGAGPVRGGHDDDCMHSWCARYVG